MIEKRKSEKGRKKEKKREEKIGRKKKKIKKLEHPTSPSPSPSLSPMQEEVKRKVGECHKGSEAFFSISGRWESIIRGARYSRIQCGNTHLRDRCIQRTVIHKQNSF